MLPVRGRNAERATVLDKHYDRRKTQFLLVKMLRKMGENFKNNNGDKPEIDKPYNAPHSKGKTGAILNPVRVYFYGRKP